MFHSVDTKHNSAEIHRNIEKRSSELWWSIKEVKETGTHFTINMTLRTACTPDRFCLVCENGMIKSPNYGLCTG